MPRWYSPNRVSSSTPIYIYIHIYVHLYIYAYTYLLVYAYSYILLYIEHRHAEMVLAEPRVVEHAGAAAKEERLARRKLRPRREGAAQAGVVLRAGLKRVRVVPSRQGEAGWRVKSERRGTWVTGARTHHCKKAFVCASESKNVELKTRPSSASWETMRNGRQSRGSSPMASSKGRIPGSGFATASG